MNDEILDLNEPMELEDGFVIHPANTVCQATIKDVEFRKNSNDTVIAVVFKLNAEGAIISEYVGLIATEKYSLQFAKQKLSAVLVATGVRKPNDTPKNSLSTDLQRTKGTTCRVLLGVRQFQSATTGKWLNTNEVLEFIEPGKKPTIKAPEPTPESEKTTTSPSYDFG